MNVCVCESPIFKDTCLADRVQNHSFPPGAPKILSTPHDGQCSWNIVGADDLLFSSAFSSNFENSSSIGLSLAPMNPHRLVVITYLFQMMTRP